MDMIRALKHLLAVAFVLIRESVGFLLLSFRSTEALRAEDLFLCGQLVLYKERKAKAPRAHDGTRLALVLISKLFTWRDALVIVKSGTLMRWHRKGLRLFWRWKSWRRGRPRLRIETQRR
ncbi:MAG TPA: hypothetical protein VE398_23665 [Acidobacteriota bacterium]|nr:hypothetical protein [Acidobacteriota bacterium]